MYTFSMKFEPYESKNLVFIDTEFTDLDPYKGELLSIGMVKFNGDELYLELRCNAERSDWVTENISPMLDGPKFKREDAAAQIQEFLGESNPFAIGFVDNYDVIYLTKIFGAGNLPFRWTTIDFASILFAMGVNPVKFLGDESGSRAFYKKLGINYNDYQKHHALDDAKLLRDVWLILTAK